MTVVKRLTNRDYIMEEERAIAIFNQIYSSDRDTALYYLTVDLIRQRRDFKVTPKTFSSYYKKWREQVLSTECDRIPSEDGDF